MTVDAHMQAWIDEQKRHFTPESMDEAVRLMRAYARQRPASPEPSRCTSAPRSRAKALTVAVSSP